MSLLKLRILLVEDDEEDFLLTTKLLRNNARTSFDVTWVTSSAAALEQLKNPYDACLVDYRLGADTGVVFIALALAKGFAGPIILLTGRGDHDTDIEAMKAGAADYLVKDELTAALIERVLRHAVERKLSEAALLRSEGQLRQAQKMEAMGSLAGGVAHDFNNLLSIVLSYSELCAEGLKDDDRMREDLAQITEAGLRAAGLTRQLLAFSHQQVLEPKVIDLNEIFAKMEQMLRRLIGEDVELVSEAQPDLRRVKADPGQVEQVIMNLVVNARDAMPRGGKLTVATKNVLLDEGYASQHVGVKAGAHVLLTVNDTGTGMDRATLARIFEPFFTTKELGKGTGLGLATVFGIVRQSGGSICVESEPGVGTTFEVYLPMVEAALSRRCAEPPPLDRISLFGTETVLLVEDDERVRALVRSILLKFGYLVLEAQSAGDAFLLSEQHQGPIDLLLTDVVMPRMSGRQLADRLLLERPEMKVLYMSGYTNDAVVRHGVNSTIAFIQKPITPEPLVRKMRQVLDAETDAGSQASGVMPVALPVVSVSS